MTYRELKNAIALMDDEIQDSDVIFNLAPKDFEPRHVLNYRKPVGNSYVIRHVLP
jgi:hypothetical protein